MLDPKLFGDGEAYGSTSLTDLIVDKKKKKQQLPAGKKGLPVPIIPAPSRKERRASKSQQRKIAKLEVSGGEGKPQKVEGPRLQAACRQSCH